VPDDGAILRPPSTDDDRLAALCVRCGACYGACPTGALQPSLSLTSVAGPWTPSLEVRPAHCTMDCNRCARVCPTDALHTPTPEEAAALGLGRVAHVDHDRCRAWGSNRACLVCLGSCPIAGALTAIPRPEGLPVTGLHPSPTPVGVPVVHADLCVGCDQCGRACVLQPYPAIGLNTAAPLGPQMPSVRDRILQMQQKAARPRL
jgi:ferredoxin